MDVEDIVRLPRQGSLLSVDASTHARLAKHARRVKRDGLEWRADSSADAAAWLLLLAHHNACLDREDGGVPGLEDEQPRNVLLAFRGQAGRHRTVVPTRWRQDDLTREHHDAAVLWFQVALEHWLRRKVRWTAPEARPIMLDHLDVEVIGQHYGLGTYFVDWTWDPLVALGFAADSLRPGPESDRTGVVLLSRFLKVGRSGMVIPPPPARRVWRQRGVLEAHYISMEHVDAPGVAPLLDALGTRERARWRGEVDLHLRLTFPIDDAAHRWARSLVADLLSDDDELTELVAWSIKAAERSLKVGYRSAHTLASASLSVLTDEVRQLGLSMPHALAPDAPGVDEDTSLVLEYLDHRAGRMKQGHFGYDQAAAAVFCEGVAGQCSLKWARGHTHPVDSAGPGIAQLRRLLSSFDPDSFWARLALLNPLFVLSRAQRGYQWNEDEWEGHDLFVPAPEGQWLH